MSEFSKSVIQNNYMGPTIDFFFLVCQKLFSETLHFKNILGILSVAVIFNNFASI